MMELMRTGGWAMWLILIFGVVLLAAAILFVRRPEDGKLGFIRGMTWAMVFTVLAGMTSGLANVFNHSGYQLEESVMDATANAMVGVSEVMSNGILGFSLLGITWLITAVGIRRLAMPPADAA